MTYNNDIKMQWYNNLSDIVCNNKYLFSLFRRIIVFLEVHVGIYFIYVIRVKENSS